MPDPREDPNWPRASAWLAGEHLPDPVGSLGVLGAPLNCSISPANCELAPDAIRQALRRFSTYDLDFDLDIRRLKARDLGNVDVAKLGPEEALEPISKAIERALKRDDAVALIGGDNGITRAGCHGIGGPIENVGLITLDAHLDLRDLDTGLNNGNPIRALLKDGLPGENIVQIGLQSFANSRSYAEIGRQAGITMYSLDRVQKRGLPNLMTAVLAELGRRVNAIYVNIDLDVLDRSFAPACPGSRPGGMMSWEVRSAARLCGLNPKVRALDLVEVDPEQDVADTTVLTAASCLLAFASGVLGRKIGAR